MNSQNFTPAPRPFSNRTGERNGEGPNDQLKTRVLKRIEFRSMRAGKLKRFGWVVSFALASVITITTAPAKAEWSIDLSRRQRTVRDLDLNEFNQPDFSRSDSVENAPANIDEESDLSSGSSSARSPASVSSRWDNSGAALDPASGPPKKFEVRESQASPLTKVLKKLVTVSEPGQELVILQTEKGFVPDTVRMRKDARYTVHIVNVNEKEKNVSFILDAFSEHHATYFGKVRTFTLEPKKDGVYSFQSPETAAEGRLIVYTQEPQVREPASAAKQPKLPQQN